MTTQFRYKELTNNDVKKSSSIWAKWTISSLEMICYVIYLMIYNCLLPAAQSDEFSRQ